MTYGEPPDLLAAAVRLVAAFDKLNSATRAERIITGLSDQDIRREGQMALADLRAAVERAVASNAGCPPGTNRLTFLPNSAFKDQKDPTP